jgi:acetamidase/formamidase
VLISIAGDVRISQIVDPAVTARVAVPKWFSPASSQ